jgi:hypothetical protein
MKDVEMDSSEEKEDRPPYVHHRILPLAAADVDRTGNSKLRRTGRPEDGVTYEQLWSAMAEV